MPNVSDVSVKMRRLRITTLQIAEELGTARANTRHVFMGARRGAWAKAGPVAFRLELLVRNRALDNEDERVNLARCGAMEDPHELVAVGEVRHELCRMLEGTPGARQPDTRSDVCQRKWIPCFHIPDKKLTSAASNRESEHSSHYLLVTYSASRLFHRGIRIAYWGLEGNRS